MRIALAYGGGFATSVGVAWLKERHGADVIAVTVDLGQGRELEAVRDRALAAGALRAHVIDGREAFASQYVLRAIRAEAVQDDGDPMPKALGRPLLAQTLVDIARLERASAVAHGCDDLMDRARLETALHALNPDLQIVAVAAERALAPLAPTSRTSAAEHHRHEWLRASSGDDRFTTDVNLWGRSYARRPAAAALPLPNELFTLTRAVTECPDEPAFVDLAFTAGTPSSVNGVAMPLIDLIVSLGTIAGAHGVGRVETPRGACEAPAAVVLHQAHRALQARTLDPETDAFARSVSRRYADLAARGGWFLPLRDALDAFVDRVQRPVTGVVTLKLLRTVCTVVDRRPDKR
jgi:argininosuccinate synthase